MYSVPVRSFTGLCVLYWLSVGLLQISNSQNRDWLAFCLVVLKIHLAVIGTAKLLFY